MGFNLYSRPEINEKNAKNERKEKNENAQNLIEVIHMEFTILVVV